LLFLWWRPQQCQQGIFAVSQLSSQGRAQGHLQQCREHVEVRRVGDSVAVQEVVDTLHRESEYTHRRSIGRQGSSRQGGACLACAQSAPRHPSISHAQQQRTLPLIYHSGTHLLRNRSRGSLYSLVRILGSGLMEAGMRASFSSSSIVNTTKPGCCEPPAAPGAAPGATLPWAAAGCVSRNLTAVFGRRQNRSSTAAAIATSSPAIVVTDSQGYLLRWKHIGS